VKGDKKILIDNCAEKSILRTNSSLSNLRSKEVALKSYSQFIKGLWTCTVQKRKKELSKRLSKRKKKMKRLIF